MLALDKAVFGSAAYTAEQWRDELANRSACVLLAQTATSGNAEAFVSAAVAGDELEIRKMGVIAASRRRGLAGKLLAQVIARIHGIYPTVRRCLIDVAADNGTAIEFYRYQGFAEIARRRKYYANGADAIVMEKILSVV